MLTRRAKIFIIFIKKRKEEEKTSWRQWLGEVERHFEFISQTQWCSALFLSKSLAKHSESFFLLQRKPKVRKRLWGGKPSFHCGRPTFTGANIQRGENGRKYGKPASNTARKARAQRCVKKGLNCSNSGWLESLKTFGHFVCTFHEMLLIPV